MQQLPKGYYAVQADFENAPKDSFTYRGVTYAVTKGVNLFGTIQEANEVATEAPDTVLEGLPYESFSAPVLLFSTGTHRIDKTAITASRILLGERAGISPSLPAESPLWHRLSIPSVPRTPSRKVSCTVDIGMAIWA